jgi:hypothetical protein
VFFHWSLVTNPRPDVVLRTQARGALGRVVTKAEALKAI